MNLASRVSKSDLLFLVWQSGSQVVQYGECGDREPIEHGAFVGIDNQTTVQLPPSWTSHHDEFGAFCYLWVNAAGRVAGAREVITGGR